MSNLNFFILVYDTHQLIIIKIIIFILADETNYIQILKDVN
jgi:hypothetical protein